MKFIYNILLQLFSFVFITFFRILFILYDTENDYFVLSEIS